MRLSRIQIENFRNFAELDGSVVVVGENRVGKSNLVHALRLIFDASLPDCARKLSLADFWNELGTPGEDDIIEVVVEIRDFEKDFDVLARLTDFRLNDDQFTVRLTYQFRPQPARSPAGIRIRLRIPVRRRRRSEHALWLRAPESDRARCAASAAGRRG
jgi:putative ATP-dependent endonuclease of the OLD family